jgi:cell division protein FtsB
MPQPLKFGSKKTSVRWKRAVLGAVILAGTIFGPGAYEQVRLWHMRRQLDEKLAALDAEHTRLTQEQQKLESDPVYVEGLIRATFRVAQPGELVIPSDD